MGKPNREILTGGKRYAQKKIKKNRVEEVTFDKDSRLEYLTGFHKRKLQRQKKAQENAQELQRQSRLEERKQIRDERKQQIQERLNQINSSRDIINYKDSSDEESDEDSESESKEQKNQDSEDESINEEWSGFGEDDEDNSENKKNGKKGILKIKQVYQIEDESAPVTGTSEVVIETLENPNAIDLNLVAKLNHVDLDKSKEVLENSINRAKRYARLINTAEKPQKVRKKKFRYLSKNERGIKNMKERNSSRNQKGRKDAKERGKERGSGKGDKPKKRK